MWLRSLHLSITATWEWPPCTWTRTPSTRNRWSSQLLMWWVKKMFPESLLFGSTSRLEVHEGLPRSGHLLGASYVHSSDVKIRMQEVLNLSAAWNCKQLCHHCKAKDNDYLKFPSQLRCLPRRGWQDFVSVCKPYQGLRSSLSSSTLMLHICATCC